MYRYQIARLERLFNFITSNEGFAELDMSLKVDIILSFFMHSYHLRDWLTESGLEWKKVDDYVKSTYELQVCRNLTHSTKHLRLVRPSPPKVFDWRSAGLPSPIAREYNPFAEIEAEREYLVILVDGNNYRCFDFMNQCMNKWREFLNRQGLNWSST